MAVKKWARKLILSKIESGGYGVDAAPAANANAIHARNATWRSWEAQGRPRNLVQPTLGTRGEPQVLQHSTLQFDVELAGAGAAGTIPKYGALLRGSAMAEVNNLGVDTQYTPVSTGEESLSNYFQMDGLQQKQLGSRGTVSFVVEPNEVPLLRFAFMGLYAKPTDTALGSPDFSGFKYPKAASSANTPTFTLDGFAFVLRSLSINLNIDREFRDLVGTKRVDVTGRAQGVRGEALVECPTMAEKDLEAMAEAESQVALQLVHGVGAGNICQLDAPKVQVLSVNREEYQGLAYARLALLFNENAGNDEVKLTVK